jgi:hypothetical protein
MCQWHVFFIAMYTHLGSDFDKSSAMQCKNHKSALDNRVIVAEKIRKEIDKDRYWVSKYHNNIFLPK